MKLHEIAILTRYIKALPTPDSAYTPDPILIFRSNRNNYKAQWGSPVPSVKNKSNTESQTIFFVGKGAFIYEQCGELLQYASQIAPDDHDPRLGKESLFADDKTMQVELMKAKASIDSLNADPTLSATLLHLRNQCIRNELKKRIEEIYENDHLPTTKEIKELFTNIRERFNVGEKTIRDIRSAIADKNHPLFINNTNLTVTGQLRTIKQNRNSLAPQLPIEIRTDPRYREIARAVMTTRIRIAAMNKKNEVSSSVGANGVVGSGSVGFNGGANVLSVGFSIYHVFPRMHGEKGQPGASAHSLVPLTTETFPNNSIPFYPTHCPVTGAALNYDMWTNGRDIAGVRVWRLTNKKPFGPGNVTIMSALGCRLIEGTMAAKTMYQTMNEITFKKWREWQAMVKE